MRHEGDGGSDAERDRQRILEEHLWRWMLELFPKGAVAWPGAQRTTVRLRLQMETEHQTLGEWEVILEHRGEGPVLSGDAPKAATSPSAASASAGDVFVPAMGEGAATTARDRRAAAYEAACARRCCARAHSPVGAWTVKGFCSCCCHSDALGERTPLICNVG